MDNTPCYIPICRDGKLGFADRDGKLVIPCELDSYTVHEIINCDDCGDNYRADFAILHKGSKFGLLNLYSGEFSEVQWDEISPEPDYDEDGNTFHWFFVRQENRVGLLGWDLETMIPCQWDTIGQILHGHACVTQNGCAGLVRLGGEVIIPCRWEAVMPWGSELVAVRKDGKWGLLTVNNAIISPCRWDQLRYAVPDGELCSAYRLFTAVCSGGKWGVLRGDGSEVSPCQWDDVSCFFAHLAGVKKDGKWGFLDFTGTLVTPCQYETIDIQFQDDNTIFYLVQKDGVQEVIPPPAQWDAATDVLPGAAFLIDQAVRINGKWGFLRGNGTWISPCQWDEAQSFNGILAPVCRDGLWGLIHRNGRQTVPCRFQALRNCTGCVFAVQDRGKWGFLNADGYPLTDCQWEDVGDFEYDLGAVKQDGKWGFVNDLGLTVLAPQWEEVQSFIFSVCPVKQDGKWGFLHRSGKLLIPCQWDSVRRHSRFRYVMYRGEQEDYLDSRRVRITYTANGERTELDPRKI